MRNIDKIKSLEDKIKFLEDQNAGLQNSLTRLKKAIKTRDIVISELKENLAGQAQVDVMLRAYIIAMVQDNGGEWTVKKDRISELIKKLPAMKTVPTEDAYVLKLDEGDDTDENMREDRL